MKLTAIQHDIRCLEWTPACEKDKGSCLYIRAYFDMTDWTLAIISDIGSYSYSWGRQSDAPDGFFKDLLCTRMTNDYFLSKLSKKVFDFETSLSETCYAVKDLLFNVNMDGQTRKEVMDEIDEIDETESSELFYLKVSEILENYGVDTYINENGLDMDDYITIIYDYTVYARRLAAIWFRDIVPNLRAVLGKV